MTIRKALISDAGAIADLIRQLDYDITVEAVSDKIKNFSRDENALLLVYQKEDVVAAFISLYFIPQIAVEGSFARISYFCVDEKYRGLKIGEAMEKYCVEEAHRRGCDRIELHSHLRRVNAHRFYEKHCYEESPKYFIKKLK